MRGREGGRGAPSTDLLVCFPTRAHLTLMPKPICSPARPSEPNKRHQHQHHYQHQHKKSTNRGGQASPLLWSKSKPVGYDISEPTSPKVTCAGQIKIRPKPDSCKNWQSVMEEIERIHNNRKHRKRPSWIEALGFKKEIMQFLTCLRSLRFDFRCFGSFPGSSAALTSDDEDEEEEEEEEFNQRNQLGIDTVHDKESSKTVFSKWFMVLQEEKEQRSGYSDNNESTDVTYSAPPPNALLLMRCRSAPAKSWLEEKEQEEEEDAKKGAAEEEEQEEELEEENKKKKDESLVVMNYNKDFYKLSTDIAKETWVVGGMRDPLSRSRSWKR